ncbi:MAG: PorV/PorQ family protein [Vicingaceae bacterium]
MRRNRVSILILLSFLSTFAMAGNEDRAGEAGASELLINPWGRSSGWGGSNSASAFGIEAMHLNVAGLAYTKGTQVNLVNTSWLSGTDVSINAAGLAQRMGESGGVLGISLMSMSFGDLDVTTVDNPDGGLGTFRPNYFNLGAAYSKNFSNTISGGVVVKLISQSIANIRATGIAIDAGVNYVTGDNDQLKFGIALRNVGPTMQYQGNGLSDRYEDPATEKQLTINQRSNDFELPSLLNIGLSYDFYLGMDPESEELSEHRLTTAGTFTSNSFTKDQFRIGAEYAFREMFMIRGGYVYEADAEDVNETQTTSAGPTFGATIEVPVGKSGATFGIDYSYRVTRTFDGTNAIGVALNF